MSYLMKDESRQRLLSGVKRVVVKVGTRLLMDVKGVSPQDRTAVLVREIAWLRQQGKEVILVTSGAIGAALMVLKKGRRPKRMEALQAYAAMGQSHLMALYEKACAENGFHCAQLLLTAADLQGRERNMKVTRCLEELLSMGILPIVNENDSVCTDEIKVGDNDTLAALVASMCRADLTILLTTINGMRERDVATGELGERISEVGNVDGELLSMASGTDGNSFSVGGMATKLHAAQITNACGELMYIADGNDFSVLRRIFNFEDVGTLFTAGGKMRLHAHQRFIAFFAEPEGELVVDAGATEAICRNGHSLLPIGVLGMRGVFVPKSVVRIVDVNRRELGRGITNYGAVELSRICGAASNELETRLGHKPPCQEVIHRDYLVITCN